MESQIQTISSFIKTTVQLAGMSRVILAVSGGIDSAVSLSLAVKAMGPDAVYTLQLPYKDQDMSDAQAVIDHTQIPSQNQETIEITSVVESFSQRLTVTEDQQLRLGNIAARCRMICVYDRAAAHQALVCGTENKSEKYLGYFTRFGDEASDLEPLQHLYKTQVRELAAHLGIPTSIQDKAPSAGLWQGQTDQNELGFEYQEADRVLEQYVGQDLRSLDRQQVISTIVEKTSLDASTVTAVIDRVEQTAYKHHVPYTL